MYECSTYICVVGEPNTNWQVAQQSFYFTFLQRFVWTCMYVSSTYTRYLQVNRHTAPASNIFLLDFRLTVTKPITKSTISISHLIRRAPGTKEKYTNQMRGDYEHCRLRVVIGLRGNSMKRNSIQSHLVVNC